MKIDFGMVVLIMTLILVGCKPSTTSVAESTDTQKATEKPAPTTIQVRPTEAILPSQSSVTPTDIQLPFNDKNVDDVYCQSPNVQLPLAQSQGIDENAIAGRLMEMWLDYFNTNQAPGYCRIDGYVIDQVFYDERTPLYPLDPKGDFIRVVKFSIKLVQIPHYWGSWPGEIDHQNWLHTYNYLAIFQSQNGYTFHFAYP